MRCGLQLGRVAAVRPVPGGSWRCPGWQVQIRRAGTTVPDTTGLHMEGINYIALSIPVFFLLIGVEWLVARWRRRSVYRLNDALNDLHCGVLQQVLGVFVKVVVFGAYVWVYETARVASIPASATWAWVACFLLVDHQYYWFHRVSHESNLPWGAHIVHHSSEEYNLAVALRQGAFQQCFSWVFYLPIALLGFSPLVFLACSSFNTLYQFWIHTRLIGKLGPLEWVLNTPSHHRVHHGCDEKYLDRNYAGVFIVWDRLYGSFQEEEEEPTYGITKPLQSWNPLWANVHYYADLVALARRAPNWRERLKVYFMPPAWRPEWAPGGPGADRERTPLTHGEAGKYDARGPGGVGLYAVVQFIGMALGTVTLLGVELDRPTQVATALFIAWTAFNLGALFEARARVLVSELARLVALPPLLAAVCRGFGDGAVSAALVAGVVAFALSAAWLLRFRPALGATSAA
ncbi:MAG: sterol desaturase family protein [Acidobacteriota bacterium]